MYSKLLVAIKLSRPNLTFLNAQAFRVSTSRSQKCLPEDINIMTKGWGEVASDHCVPYRRKS